MRKNRAVTCLVLMLLLTALPALASNQANAFVYRDGITFGMTIDEVRNLEKNMPAPTPNPLYDFSLDRREKLVYENEIILTFPCKIEYLFGDDGLEQISVSIYDTSDPVKLMEDFAAIDSALIKKYGEPDGPTDISSVPGVMNFYTHWGSKIGERSFIMWHNIVTTNGTVGHSIQYKYDADLADNYRPDGGI